MGSRILSVKTLSLKKTHVISDLPPLWTARLGHVERNFRAMIAGPSTSGKSVFSLQLADTIADTGRKVLYNNWEEGHNKTVIDRINRYKIDAPRLYIADRMPFGEMVDKIRRNHYGLIAIDSVPFMAFTYDEYKELTKLFPKKSMLFVAHADSPTSFDNVHAKNINKACDIKIFINKGVARIISRYGVETEEQLYKVQPANKNPQQPQLEL